MAAEDEEDIYNIVTMEVMTEKVSRDILKWDEIGQRKCRMLDYNQEQMLHHLEVLVSN